MVYMGVDEQVIPPDFIPHHQIIRGRPLGETNSIFLSLSPGWDSSRAPSGKRAVTISTHTDLRSWWDLYHNDPQRYQARRQKYQDKILQSVESILPGIVGASSLVMPGTPVTFEKFTRRTWGWVGGYPQTSLLRVQPPKLSPGIWMVGDSIFPGQSMPAVALGGLRVASLILKEELGVRRVFTRYHHGPYPRQTAPSN